jgi:hypothetical protein
MQGVARRQSRRWLLLLGATFVFLLVMLAVAGNALADVPVKTPTYLVLPQTQLWTLVIGSLVPLVTYVLNHYAPWVSEPIKGIVLALVAAGASALYTALSTNVIGFNNTTYQLVISAVIAAFLTHVVVWKPSGISVKLGGGTNARPAISNDASPA